MSTTKPTGIHKSYVDTQCAGLLCFLLFLYVAGNIFVIGYVHWQMVYLQPDGSPGLQQNAVYYYTYINPVNSATYLNASNIAPANYLSGVSLALYGEDLMRFFVPLLVAGWVMLAVPCNSDSTTLPIVIIVIYSLYDLGKFIYFILVDQSSLTTTQCAEYPFCTSRDSSQTANTPDSAFTAELWANLAFFLFTILIAVVLYRSIRKNEAYDATKRAQYMAIQQNIGNNDSDSDDGRPLPVRQQQQQEALVVETRSTRRRTAPPTKNIGHEIPRILVSNDSDDFYL